MGGCGERTKGPELKMMGSSSKGKEQVSGELERLYLTAGFQRLSWDLCRIRE